MNGRKILMIEWGKLRFIDSLSYMPMELAALPKAFGLTETKGFYPHKLKSTDERGNDGRYPDPEAYDPGRMSPEKREEFYTWYASVSHLPFCPKTELEEYCKRDVTVLRQACIKFREIFMDATGVCPFSKPITIAGACFDAYRTSFMSDQVIGVLPRRGYVHADEQSKKALQWLLWREKEDGLQRPMLHAGRGRERRIIKNLRVDGVDVESESADVRFSMQPRAWSNPN
ncbi:hypothetical protein QAD02_016050 [Eretmocerus hayati]|uniref:Uncharacterized protein n=1 Tax=Eretmocerus hayati TaxID=131215 RepID=A0ACC2PAX6_9HYME|nr:hypothetical protein QAD02_016050 [Eretmocerus hayati]